MKVEVGQQERKERNSNCAKYYLSRNRSWGCYGRMPYTRIRYTFYRRQYLLLRINHDHGAGYVF